MIDDRAVTRRCRSLLRGETSLPRSSRASSRRRWR
jgi:hypothetical protein